MHRNYLVFLDVTDPETSSLTLNIGQIVHVCWVSPNDSKDMDPQPFMWKGQVIPPLLGDDAPGNLLLIITRPSQDPRQLEINNAISSEMKFASEPIYLFPQTFDLLAKQLVNALNLAHNGESEKFDILRRILMAQDLSRIQFGQSLREQDIYEIEFDTISLLKRDLSASQRIAINRVLGSKNFIEFVTGPFGTGKTTFIAILIRCLVLLGKKVLLCCSSNFAVDTIASRIEKSSPGLKAIRFHSANTETRCINHKPKIQRKAFAKAIQIQSDDEATSSQSRQQGDETPEPSQQEEQTAKSQPVGEAAEPESNKQREQAAEGQPVADLPAFQPTGQATETKGSDDLTQLNRALARLIPLSIFLARKAGSKKPNFLTMSLMARCLAYAGLEGDKEIPQGNGDPHKHFRELFLRGDENDENFDKQFKQSLERLQQDLFLHTSVVLTT